MGTTVCTSTWQLLTSPELMTAKECIFYSIISIFHNSLSPVMMNDFPLFWIFRCSHSNSSAIPSIDTIHIQHWVCTAYNIWTVACCLFLSKDENDCFYTTPPFAPLIDCTRVPNWSWVFCYCTWPLLVGWPFDHILCPQQTHPPSILSLFCATLEFCWRVRHGTWHCASKQCQNSSTLRAMIPVDFLRVHEHCCSSFSMPTMQLKTYQCNTPWC